MTAPAWCSKLQRRDMDQLSWAALLADPWSGSLPGRAALQLQQQCVLQLVMGARHGLCRPVMGTKRRQHICMLYRLSQCSAVASSNSSQCVLLPERRAPNTKGCTCPQQSCLLLLVLHAACRLSQFSAIVIFREDGSRPTLLSPRVVGSEQALGDADARSLACLLLLRHIQVLQRKGLPVDAGECHTGGLWLICFGCPQCICQRSALTCPGRCLLCCVTDEGAQAAF